MDGKRKNILPGSVKKIVVEMPPPDTIISEKVKVQSLIDSDIYYTGQVSGELYRWNKAGAIVEVDERDVSELLKRRYGKKTCCGESRSNLIFQLAE